MLAVLTLLRSPLGRALGIALAVGLVALELMHVGANNVRKQVAAQQATARADVVTHEAKAVAISVQASQGLSEAHAGAVARLAPLIKRIPTDVSAQVDRDCRVPSGFVSLWNAGAASVDAGFSPGSGGGSEKPASPGSPPT